MLTWLRLYNSPERVTSSRVGIPGLFFFSLLRPISFFFLFYWKGGVTGLGGGGLGGCSYCGTFVREPVAEARAGFTATSARCKAPSICFLTRVGSESEQSWSDGVLRSPCLGFTPMATGVNMLYGRGISAARCF